MSKSNADIIEKFFAKDHAHNDNMESYGDKLMSFNTCIAQHMGLQGIVINITHYDNHMDRQVKLLRSMIGNAHKTCVCYLSNVPKGTTNLRVIVGQINS